MTLADPLCVLPTPPEGGCCDPPAPPPAAPIIPTNPPGLSAIRYRIGTFSSFRRAMLAQVARADLLGTSANPFARWRAGIEGDYQTALIELWAYLADILTFYQERIANEAYLPTATQRDSLLGLTTLIAYRPGPGAGASALLAFTVEKGKSLTIPARFRAGSKAAPGRPAAIFETETAINAIGEYSAIPLSAVAPTNQFAPLSAYRLLFKKLPVIPRPRPPKIPKEPPRIIFVDEPRQAATMIYGSAGAAYLQTFIGSLAAEPAVFAQPGVSVINQPGILATNPGAPGVAKLFAADVPAASDRRSAVRERSDQRAAPIELESTRSIVLKGANNRLSVGDYVLLIETTQSAAGDLQETPLLRQIAQVSADKIAGTTTIDWIEDADATYDLAASHTLYALRVTGAPFGNNAPNWYGLPPALNNIDTQNPKAPFQNTRWDDPGDPWSFLPKPSVAEPTPMAADPANVVFLDSLYPAARGAPENPGWAVLMTDAADAPSPLPPGVASIEDKAFAIFHVTDARPASKAAYAISGKVTRLTFADDEAIPGMTFPLRNTVVLTGDEPLELQNNLLLPEPLSGATLVLAGLYPQLQAGQTVIVRGNLFDLTTTPPSQAPGVEAAILAGPPALDAENNITTVTLKKPLANRYARAGAALLANVVSATHGETVRDETLGSGDGSAFQTYSLKQKPLTYLPATDAEGLAAVKSTLQVTVNGVRWSERATLLASAPNDQVFTTALDDSSQTTVIFGDGQFGARPPTGVGNIHARYRKGLGAAGNVTAGAIQQLVDSTPGIQKVANPQPATGGADMERPDQIRTNAPASRRTFGRAVSVDDYAALALSFPGVAKASAAWAVRDAATLRAIAQPYIQLTVATTDLVPLAQQPNFGSKLRAFLDQRRDPNVPLRIVDFTPVFIDVAATIDVDDRFGRQATLAAALAALNPGPNPDNTAGYFAFERLDLGQSIHLSAVYTVLQAVPGVSEATITTLRRANQDTSPATVRDDIFVGPTEIVVIKNDPADAANQFGKLTITLGKGGFIDT